VGRNVALLAVIVGVALVQGSCGQNRAPTAVRSASPTVARAGQEAPLTAFDVQMFLAVRGRALQRLEDALNEVEASGGDILGRVQELTVAEREAARSLGVDWRRYTWVRDQIGRLMTSQRQREDQRVLGAELTRAKQDLSGQLEAARDPASRQFLEAQLKALTVQLDKLEREQQVPPQQAEEAKLLESSRAEIATLQGRQDRVQHRLQVLLEHSTQAGTAQPTRPAR
jgi:chromosome segregation ATPase